MPRKSKLPKVVTYGRMPAGGVVGYVEPPDRGWILFFDREGHAEFSPARAADGGVRGRSYSTRPGLRRDWTRAALAAARGRRATR